MAETLPNDTVIPQGSDLIHSSGVQAMRNLGVSVDGQLGNRYTKAEADALLAGKSPVGHTHDDRYYTEAEVDAMLDAVAARFDPVELTAENLNTVTQERTYTQSQTGEASLALNYPVARAGLLTVARGSNSGYITMQRYTEFDGRNTYWRMKYGSTWYPWKRSYSADEAATALAGKANSVHSHPITGVTGLQAALDGKAALSHTHTLSQMAGLQAEIDSKFAGIASAYDVAYAADPTVGTVDEWLASLVGPQGIEGPYGGTAVTDPQVASYVTSSTETRSALDARYRGRVSVAEYGATGDGTTDDTAAVQTALTQNPGNAVHFPPGHYRFTENLSIPDGVNITGAGSDAVTLDWSTKPEWSGQAFLTWETGTLEAGVPLTADTAFGQETVAVAEVHDFAPGDYVRITSNEVAFGEAVKAEFQRVLSVDGSTLTLASPIFDQYSVAMLARVERAHLSTGSIEGVSILGRGVNASGYGDNAIDFQLARDIRVRDVKFERVENRCIRLDSVLGADVDGCRFLFDVSRTPLQYGLSINGASQLVKFRGSSSWNDRHMVTTSTSPSLAESATTGRGIPRVVAISGNTAHGSWQCPIDTHRAGEYITVIGNALTSDFIGIKIRGKHSLVSGNILVGKKVGPYGTPSGVRVGMGCEDVQVTGNSIRGFENGIMVATPDGETRGLIVSENSVVGCKLPLYVQSSTPITGLRVAGNLFRAVADGYPIYLSTSLEDFEVSGNTLEGGVIGLYAGGAGNTIARVVVQSNTCRGQSSRGMFLQDLTDGLVTGNFSPTSEIRFAGACLRVVEGLNVGTITDLSTPGITRK